ncbi:MAG: sulfatase-like hydrolase/transferase, partial [Planctomycetaceae bacterium]
IVVIFIDDMGFADPSCFGNPLMKTPHIDQLAKEGIKLTNFYVNSPIWSRKGEARLQLRLQDQVQISVSRPQLRRILRRFLEKSWFPPCFAGGVRFPPPPFFPVRAIDCHGRTNGV